MVFYDKKDQLTPCLSLPVQTSVLGDLPPEGTLHYSALQGEVDRLRDYFTRENAHPDTVDDSGRTPLVSSGALHNRVN